MFLYLDKQTKMYQVANMHNAIKQTNYINKNSKDLSIFSTEK